MLHILLQEVVEHYQEEPLVFIPEVRIQMELELVPQEIIYQLQQLVVAVVVHLKVVNMAFMPKEIMLQMEMALELLEMEAVQFMFQQEVQEVHLQEKL